MCHSTRDNVVTTLSTEGTRDHATKPVGRLAGRAVAGPLHFAGDADPARSQMPFLRERFQLTDIAAAMAEVRHSPGVSGSMRRVVTHGSDLPYDPARGQGEEGGV